MPQVVVEMSGDDARLWASVQRCIQAEQGLENQLDKVSQASKKAAADFQKLEQAGIRVYEETRTPQERYEARMEHLNQLLNAGTVTQQEYGRAAGQAKEQLDAAGASGAKAFGSNALSDIKNYVGGLVGISAALATVGAVYQELQRVKDEAAQRARESEFGYGSLAQVSGGDPEKFKANVATARRIAGTAGMDENQATRFTFALLSAGGIEEADTFAAAFKAGVITNPEMMVRASVAMQHSMTKAKTGSLHNILSMAMGASESAPSKMPELLAATARAGPFAKMAGMTPEETMVGHGGGGNRARSRGGRQPGRPGGPLSCGIAGPDRRR